MAIPRFSAVRAARIAPEAGDVVAFERNGRWYTAFVTRVDGGTLHVTWGDGKPGTLQNNSFVLVVDLPSAQIAPLPFAAVKKNLLTKRKPKTSVEVVPEDMRTEEELAPAPKDKLAGKLPAEIPEQLVQMYPLLGDQGLANRPKQLWFMQHLWTHLNTTKFGNKLKLPNLEHMRTVPNVYLRTRAYWQSGSRRLVVSPRMFNLPLAGFVEIFLHEMCHQAVSDLDWATMSSEEKSAHHKEAGHGPNWKAWMVKVGLNPLRFDPRDNMQYQGDSESIKKELLRKLMKLAQENKLVAWHSNYGYVYCGALVRWVGTEDDQVVVKEGVVLAGNATKYAVVTNAQLNGPKYSLVPAKNLFIVWNIPAVLNKYKVHGHKFLERATQVYPAMLHKDGTARYVTRRMLTMDRGDDGRHSIDEQLVFDRKELEGKLFGGDDS